MNDPNANTEHSLPEQISGPRLDATLNWNEDEDQEALVPMEDFSNRMLGEFRLLRLLGRGGMAEVYLADQTSLNRKVAIKILRPDMKANSVFLKRFEREARAAASLSHPNIVQVYVVGEEDGLHFIAQEYVKGLNLREYIRRKGPPNAQLGLHFMRQIVQALHKAGGAGIVHRDIKPENMLITNKGVIKVADFGLAQLSHPDLNQSSLELTQVGTTMGTPLYMSPEQIHGQKLDQRSDLYSFGVTCFHMLAGEPPFHGETTMSVAVQHLNAKPPSLRKRRPDLPPALCQIVHRLMAKDPDQRYPDAATLLKDIKHIQSALKDDVDPESLNLSGMDWETDEQVLQPGWLKRMAGWSRKRKLAAYLAACLAIGGVSALAGWWTRPADPLKHPLPSQPKIPAKPTAEGQYKLALQNFSSDEEAWDAVIQNFPQDEEYVYRAQEQLGMLYLRNLKLERAAKIFEDMSQLQGGRLEAEFRARARAGQAVIADLQGDDATAEQLIRQLPPLSHDSPLERPIDEMKRRKNIR